MVGKSLRQCGAGVMALLLLMSLALSTAAMPDDAAGATAPSPWLSPLEFHFGPVAVGQTATRAVTVRNSGNATLTLDGGNTTAPFAADTSACAGGVAPGGSCQIIYAFTPREAGDFEAASAGGGNAGAWGVRLHGRGVAPQLRVNPQSLDFGGGLLTDLFDSQTVTLTNVGSVPIRPIQAEAAPEPFTVGDNCAKTLAPGQSCTLEFDFIPTLYGVFNRRWTAKTDAGPIAVDLLGRVYTGTVGTGQRVTPRALDFGPVRVGRNSPPLVVTFYNHDPIYPLTNWDFSWVVDELPLTFRYTENCPEQLLGGQSCEVIITYAPQVARRDEALLTVLTSQGIVNLRLTGSGVGSDVVARSLDIDLGAPPPADGATTETVEFINQGLAPVEVSAPRATAPFAAQDVTCVGKLEPGETCQVVARYDPADYGRHHGALALVTGDGEIPVQLEGGTMTPELSLAFAPAAARAGDTVRLLLTFVNRDPSRTLFGVGAEGALPAGLVVAATAISHSPACGQPRLAAATGGSALALRDATIMAGATCVVEVSVRPERGGVFPFSTRPDSSAGPGAPAAAQLTATGHGGGPPRVFYIPLTVRP